VSTLQATVKAGWTAYLSFITLKSTKMHLL